ncbi:ExbD/TolR family protein [Flaviaesturariibacter aridisoli]|uniref:Biopolymer transporter ExbD n=1 Tax=Flaviaesturariibacter aridisoli TaxID=2545761 RepID=A0A4R4DTT7_9BACT|nr:biopolymer transporter ExbD [Flaviaesturariibacter aridisoli]TCZ66421.1 biopolymer transporter ExbD [Flaviaesturariibacter aridisoli]
MASVETAALGSKRKGHLIPKVDMTPMVDLGFLLITFFIFTTSMGESRALQLVMPADGPPMNSMESATLSVLLDSSQVFAYRGQWEKAVPAGGVQPTTLNTYTGMGAVIRALQQDLRARGRHDSDLVLLIKPAARADYRQVVDAIDMALIYNVKRYAIVEPEKEERAFLEKRDRR